MDKVRIYFKDNGQDFLFWDIDVQQEKVIDSPGQQMPWLNRYVVNLEEILSGESFRITIVLGREHRELIHNVIDWEDVSKKKEANNG
ncbi:MAG: hypothetical protein ACFB2Y_16835 [Fulvivirga sp.]